MERKLVFIDEYTQTIDAKNRLLIPADYRNQIDVNRDGEGWILKVGTNWKLWCYPEGSYQRMVSQFEQELAPDDDELAFAELHYARASRVVADKNGRIVVPDRLLRRAKLGTEVSVIGKNDHIEVWNTSDWDARQDELDAIAKEVNDHQRAARRAANQPGGAGAVMG